MGGPMANRLLDAGHTLCVFDTNAEAVKPLAARGARVASSAEDVASSADMVLISLPTPPIVQAVSLGERGILKGSRLKTLIDLSTTGPTIAGVVAKSAAERGVSWVDSPVSGGIGGATKGTLAVMVSCRKDTFPHRRSRPPDFRQDVLRRREARPRADCQTREQSAGCSRDRAVVRGSRDGREGGSRREDAHATSSTPVADATARRRTSSRSQ